MENPTISVVIPAYNCERYIHSAISSVLHQSFRDFEVIVIDDGSTDQTAEIIMRINDNRLRLLRNGANRGLVYTLNRGIDEASGKYIARMDGDDLSMPTRFEEQVKHLDAHPDTGLVTCVADLIDADGNPVGEWEDDRRNISYAQIRGFLPRNNCIVHPAVMMRTDLLKRYRFRHEQAQAEDYDLWLRLAADHVQIDKLGQPLLQHRIVTQSFTRKRQRNIFWKNARTKLGFVKHALATAKINPFVLRTALSGFSDLVLGLAKRMKNTIRS